MFSYFVFPSVLDQFIPEEDLCFWSGGLRYQVPYVLARSLALSTHITVCLLKPAVRFSPYVGPTGSLAYHVLLELSNLMRMMKEE